MSGVIFMHRVWGRLGLGLIVGAISKRGCFYAQGQGNAWIKTDIVELLVSGVIFMHSVWGTLGLGLILWSY